MDTVCMERLNPRPRRTCAHKSFQIHPRANSSQIPTEEGTEESSWEKNFPTGKYSLCRNLSGKLLKQ